MPTPNSAALAPGLTRNLRGRFRLAVGLGLGWTVLLAWVAFTTPAPELVQHPAWVFPFTLWAPFELWMPGWPVRLVLQVGLGVGTLVLGAWTLRRDQRPGVRGLGVGLMLLLLMEAVLGIARLVWISARLSMLHAAIDPLFFAILVALGVFTSRTWIHAETDAPAHPALLPTGPVLGLLGLLYLLFLAAAALPPVFSTTAPPWGYIVLDVSALALVGGCAAWTWTRPATAYPHRRWATALLAAALALFLIGYGQVEGLLSTRLVYMLHASSVAFLWASAVGFALWALRTDAVPTVPVSAEPVPHPALSGLS